MMEIKQRKFINILKNKFIKLFKKRAGPKFNPRAGFLLSTIPTTAIPLAAWALGITNINSCHSTIRVTTISVGTFSSGTASTTFIATIAAKMAYTARTGHNFGNTLSSRVLTRT